MICVAGMQGERLFQDQSNLLNEEQSLDLSEPTNPEFRTFGEERWSLPEGSPIASQNYFEYQDIWRPMNPHPPIVPDYWRENPTHFDAFEDITGNNKSYKQ